MDHDLSRAVESIPEMDVKVQSAIKEFLSALRTINCYDLSYEATEEVVDIINEATDTLRKHGH